MKIMVMKHTPQKATAMPHSLEVLRSIILERYASPGTEIECCFPEDLLGGGAVHSRQMQNKVLSGFDRHLLAPAIIKKALEAQERGFDAVVLTNTYDPGVEGARFVVRIPILGVARASCHLASILSDKIGIIVPFETHLPNTYRLLQSYGLEGRIATIVPANPPVSKDKSYEEVLQCFRVAGEKCVAAGAQIVIPLCGVFVPMTIPAQVLAGQIGVQVIDTLSVGIGLAEWMVRFGITHSEKAYPFLEMQSADIAGQSRDGT